MNQLVVELTINWIEVVEELTVNWIEIAEKLVELLHRLACANIASSMKADNKTIVEKKNWDVEKMQTSVSCQSETDANRWIKTGFSVGPSFVHERGMAAELRKDSTNASRLENGAQMRCNQVSMDRKLKIELATVTSAATKKRHLLIVKGRNIEWKLVDKE